MPDYGFQPGQSPSDRRAALDLQRRLNELDARTAALEGAPRAKMFHTAPGAGGTTAGTTSLSVMSVTVPAQGVPGNVFVQVHAYVTFSTSGDGFELYIADSTNPSGQLVSARINTIAGTVREVNVAPHLMLPVADGLVRTYQFRLQRTGGTGTASAFGDPRYLRMTALWIPT